MSPDPEEPAATGRRAMPRKRRYVILPPARAGGAMGGKAAAESNERFFRAAGPETPDPAGQTAPAVERPVADPAPLDLDGVARRDFGRSRQELIAETAYHRSRLRAAGRNDPVADWLEAEAAIDTLLRRSGR